MSWLSDVAARQASASGTSAPAAATGFSSGTPAVTTVPMGSGPKWLQDIRAGKAFTVEQQQQGLSTLLDSLKAGRDLTTIESLAFKSLPKADQIMYQAIGNADRQPDEVPRGQFILLKMDDPRRKNRRMYKASEALPGGYRLYVKGDKKMRHSVQAVVDIGSEAIPAALQAAGYLDPYTATAASSISKSIAYKTPLKDAAKDLAIQEGLTFATQKASKYLETAGPKLAPYIEKVPGGKSALQTIDKAGIFLKREIGSAATRKIAEAAGAAVRRGVITAGSQAALNKGKIDWKTVLQNMGIAAAVTPVFSSIKDYYNSKEAPAEKSKSEVDAAADKAGRAAGDRYLAAAEKEEGIDYNKYRSIVDQARNNFLVAAGAGRTSAQQYSVDKSRSGDSMDPFGPSYEDTTAVGALTAAKTFEDLNKETGIDMYTGGATVAGGPSLKGASSASASVSRSSKDVFDIKVADWASGGVGHEVLADIMPGAVRSEGPVLGPYAEKGPVLGPYADVTPGEVPSALLGEGPAVFPDTILGGRGSYAPLPADTPYSITAPEVPVGVPEIPDFLGARASGQPIQVAPASAPAPVDNAARLTEGPAGDVVPPGGPGVDELVGSKFTSADKDIMGHFGIDESTPVSELVSRPAVAQQLTNLSGFEGLNKVTAGLSENMSNLVNTETGEVLTVSKNDPRAIAVRSRGGSWGNINLIEYSSTIDAVKGITEQLTKLDAQVNKPWWKSGYLWGSLAIPTAAMGLQMYFADKSAKESEKVLERAQADQDRANEEAKENAQSLAEQYIQEYSAESSGGSTYSGVRGGTVYV